MEQITPPSEIISSSSSDRLKPFPETLFQNVPQDVLDIINQKRENVEVNGKFVNWLMKIWVNIRNQGDISDKVIKPLNNLFEDNNIKGKLKITSYKPKPKGKKPEPESEEEESSLEELSEDEFSTPKVVKVKKEPEEEYKIEYEHVDPLVVSDKALVEFIYFIMNEEDFGENYDYDEFNSKLYELKIPLRIIEINITTKVPAKYRPEKFKTVYKNKYEISYAIPLKIKE